MQAARAPGMATVSEVPGDIRGRVLIENVRPTVDGGRYPVKRVMGDLVTVEVDLIADSHDVLGGRLLYRRCGEEDFRAAPLTALRDDRYAASFLVDALGRWQFTVEGWVDEFRSFQRVLERKLQGATPDDVVMQLRQGAHLFKSLAKRVPPSERHRLLEAARLLDDAPRDPAAARATALDEELALVVRALPDSERTTQAARIFEVEVERARARFSAWYEFFPRSCRDDGKHASFRDCESRLVYAAQMGFDVVYLPPIHPIGESFRKGRDNSLTPHEDDPGSPWAVGSAQGGHKDIHPELGTLEDFRWFVARARQLGLEVALDIALQVSPDHPYVREHPEWFLKRPDGSIQYAENPPKKYQDIYPFDFQCKDAPALFRELESIFEYWIAEGIKIFRVDNPHTKSLPFWRWCIGALKQAHPDLVLLAEAFTRPKLMRALAKLGFSQSYTYFTWRTTKHELTSYFTELTQTELVEYFRPNLWPNTPDILPENLQFGNRAAYVTRLVLAATLGSNYGIYGPAFELMESEARPGSGEYSNNEKYELRRWDVSRPDSLRSIIQRLNGIRRDNPALQDDRSLKFHSTDNDMLLCYSKRTKDDVIVVVVNLDPHHVQSGFVHLDLGALGVDSDHAFQAHDLLSGARFFWSSARNYVELDPTVSPAHVLRLRRRIRREEDFDYFA
jgi:starch synthase (maltosyl-transferring)